MGYLNLQEDTNNHNAVILPSLPPGVQTQTHTRTSTYKLASMNDQVHETSSTETYLHKLHLHMKCKTTPPPKRKFFFKTPTLIR